MSVCLIVLRFRILTVFSDSDDAVDIMDIEGATNSNTASLKRLKVGGDANDLNGSSLNNHMDIISRPQKRQNDEPDVDERMSPPLNPKRRRSPPLESDVHSQVPQGHETSNIDISVPDRMAAWPDPSLDDREELPAELLRDLETRPITVAQLIQEVKGIYAGLGMYALR